MINMTTNVWPAHRQVLRTMRSRLATNMRERRDARELGRVLGTAQPAVRRELTLMAQRHDVPFVP